MNSTAFKIAIFNIVIIFGLCIGLSYGIIQPIFYNDASYVSYVLAMMMSSILILVSYDSIYHTNWIMNFVKFEEKNLYRIALIGTLIGLVYLVSIIGEAVSHIDNPDLGMILTAFAKGLRTSFNPTLIGIGAWVWTSHLIYFSKRK